MTINNNNIFGAFTLGEIRSGRLTGDWLNKESVANYGWFGGGTPVPGAFSTVDRIDFSNDSVNALARGPLSSARYSAGATGNSNYGWWGGGAFPSVSIVDRIDFSSDSSTASVRGSLTSNRRFLTATGNSNYGWFGGGSANDNLSIVDRIDFSNDSSTTSSRGPLSSARLNSTTTANSNYGWFGGGATTFLPTTPTSSVDRIDFSNDFSTASPRGPLTLARNILAATGNANYGWFGGGYAPSSTRSTVDRIDFSNDLSTALVRGSLNPSVGRQDLAATGNSNYGWFGGGQIPASPTPLRVSTVDRIDFSNDSVTASLRGGVLSQSRSRPAATSGVLNIRRQKAGNYGWFGGGYIPTPAKVAIVDRIDFSNDSITASPSGALTLARTQLAATGNSNYGWFGGGLYTPPVGPAPGAPTNIVDRKDFSNDSVITSPRGPLSQVKYALAATGNSNYGWFVGGLYFFAPTPSGVTIDRINFSNDLATISSRLIFEKYPIAATGNSNYAWFGGYGVSTVNRMDFSNDSAPTSLRGPLSLARQNLAATGNSNYGWFGGGLDTTTATVATVDRIDFSNDSATASVRGPLSLARYYLAATGNSNYGWFAGGTNPSLPNFKSTVDRMNFSNDLAVLTRQPLSPPRAALTATSNTNK